MLVTKNKVPNIGHPQLRGSATGLKYPTYAEVKIDGEFNFLVYQTAKNYGNIPSKCFTINKYGTTRENFPALNEIKGILKEKAVLSAMFLCEVYWNEGKKGALYDLLSHKKDDNIKLAVFDLIGYNGDCRQNDLLTRLEMLQDLGLGHLQPNATIANNTLELGTFFHETVDKGFEGIVAKPMDAKFVSGPCTQAKLKYKDRNDYRVNTVDNIKERIEIKRQLADSSFVYVGVKAPNRYKAHIKVGDLVTIEHQGVLASGSLRHPVLIARKEWK